MNESLWWTNVSTKVEIIQIHITKLLLFIFKRSASMKHLNIFTSDECVGGGGDSHKYYYGWCRFSNARNKIHSYTKEKEPTEKHKIFMLLFMRFVFVRPLIRKILIKNIIPKTVIGYRISSSSCMAMLFFLRMPMVFQHRKLKLRSRIGNLLRQMVCFGWGRELEFTLYRAHWHRNQRPNLDNDSIKNGHCH